MTVDEERTALQEVHASDAILNALSGDAYGRLWYEYYISEGGKDLKVLRWPQLNGYHGPYPSCHDLLPKSGLTCSRLRFGDARLHNLFPYSTVRATPTRAISEAAMNMAAQYIANPASSFYHGADTLHSRVRAFASYRLQANLAIFNPPNHTAVYYRLLLRPRDLIWLPWNKALSVVREILANGSRISNDGSHFLTWYPYQHEDGCDCRGINLINSKSVYIRPEDRKSEWLSHI